MLNLKETAAIVSEDLTLTLEKFSIWISKQGCCHFTVLHKGSEWNHTCVGGVGLSRRRFQGKVKLNFISTIFLPPPLLSTALFSMVLVTQGQQQSENTK